MDVLIVGGGGHVSGAVARAALRRGHQVWALTRGRRALPEGVRSLVADRGDLEAMAAVVRSLVAKRQWSSFKRQPSAEAAAA